MNSWSSSPDPWLRPGHRILWPRGHSCWSGIRRRAWAPGPRCREGACGLWHRTLPFLSGAAYKGRWVGVKGTVHDSSAGCQPAWAPSPALTVPSPGQTLACGVEEDRQPREQEFCLVLTAVFSAPGTRHTVSSPQRRVECTSPCAQACEPHRRAYSTLQHASSFLPPRRHLGFISVQRGGRELGGAPNSIHSSQLRVG